MGVLQSSAQRQMVLMKLARRALFVGTFQFNVVFTVLSGDCARNTRQTGIDCLEAKSLFPLFQFVANRLRDDHVV